MKSLLHHFSAVKGVDFGADVAWLLDPTVSLHMRKVGCSNVGTDLDG